jgi:hypothetical protein
MPENLNTVYMYIMLCNALWILVAAARLSSRTAALKNKSSAGHCSSVRFTTA